MSASRRRILLLIDVDKHTPSSNFAHNLNIRQQSFGFRTLPAKGVGRRLARLKCSNDELMAKIRRLYSRSHRGFPVLVTDAPFRDIRYGWMDPHEAMLVSIAGAAKLRRESARRAFLCAMIADLLMNMFVDTPGHDLNVDCVSDAPRNKAQLSRYLGAKSFCADCKLTIDAAVRDGSLTERQRADIESVLAYGASRQCFVLMPFRRSLLPVFKRVVRAGEGRGWEVKRADRLGDAHVMAAVLERIRSADLVVADLTGSTPNVMYEVGYAHALGRSVVLLTQDIRKVPFDVSGQRVHPYDRSDLNGLSRTLLRYFPG